MSDKILKSKKFVYTSLAAVALMGVGTAAAVNTHVFGNDAIATVHADEYEAIDQIAATWNDGDGSEPYVDDIETDGPVYLIPNKVVAINVPKWDGYTANESVVHIKVNATGDGFSPESDLLKLVYTANSASSTSSSAASSSQSAASQSSSATQAKATNSSSAASSASQPATKASSSSQAASAPSSSATNNGNGGTKATTSTTATATTLATQKANAKATINGDSKLTATEKANAIKAIDAATTPAGVAAVVSAAKQGTNASTGAAASGSAAKLGDVQTGVTNNAFAGIAGGVATFLGTLGLALRKLVA